VTNNQRADRFDEDSGIQRYLQEHGYSTAIFGKYLLGRPNSQNPAHFDEWAIFRRSPPAYKGGLWNVDGTVQEVPEYSTQYIGDRAVEFINEREALDVEPWMMMLSTPAPHAPYISEGQYRHARVSQWQPNPAAPERDLSDKPPLHGLGETTVREAKRVRRKQLRTLISVDDMVERVFATLKHTREENTLAFFLSDNGFMWAEHGLFSKRYPYVPSSKIPLMMRWPGHVEPGSVDRDLVATIDIAPTIMEAAGITPDPEYPVDGHSLLGQAQRNRLLLEFQKEHNIWTWASTITRDDQYIEYYVNGSVRFREYYDLRRDPWQLRNLYGDDTASNDPNRAMLSRRLHRDRSCSGTECP
jgi:arylsulfatase A-like enzyme